MNVDELAALAEYTRAVVEAWEDKRGSQLPPTNNPEFMLIRSWHQRGIPLRVTLRGIMDIRRVPRQDMTLNYAKPAVEEAYSHWRRNMTL